MYDPVTVWAYGQKIMNGIYCIIRAYVRKLQEMMYVNETGCD